MELKSSKNIVVTFSKRDALKENQTAERYVPAGCRDFAYEKLLQNREQNDNGIAICKVGRPNDSRARRLLQGGFSVDEYSGVGPSGGRRRCCNSS